MRNEYFFSFILGTIVGVLLENFVNLGYSFAILCIAMSFVIFLVAKKGSDMKYGFIVSLLLIGCAFGVLRVDVSQRERSAHVLDRSLESTVRLEGVVVREPDVREAYTNIVLEVNKVAFHETQNVLY